MAACIDLYNVSISTIVGKGGATLRKLEKELPEARLDLLKHQGFVRLRGPLTAGHHWVNTTKKRLLTSIDALRSAATITMQSAAEEKKIADYMDIICATYGVDAKKEGDNSYIFRGDASSVEEARQYTKELLSDSATRKIPVGRHDVDAVNCSLGDFFCRVRKKWNLEADSIRAVPSGPRYAVAYVEIKAPFGIIDKVKETVRKELVRVLDPTTFSSSQWEQKAMPLVCCLSTRESMKELGLHVEADRTAGLIYMTQRCDAPSLMNVSVGLVKIKELMSVWRETRSTLPVEERMITSIVGKGGSNISALQKKTRSTIKLDRPNLCLDIQSPDVDTLKSTVEVLQQVIEGLREGLWSGIISKASLGAFLGKGGAHISKLRKETGASIELDNKTLVVKVYGSREQTEAAKAAIESFIELEREKNHSVRCFYPSATRSAIIGAKGATVREIQESTGCRLDLHKTLPELTLSGSKEGCAESRKRLLAIITGAGHSADEFGIIDEPETPAAAPVEEIEPTAEKEKAQSPTQPMALSPQKRRGAPGPGGECSPEPEDTK